MIYASAGIPCQLDPAEPKAKADTGEEFLITADPALPCCFQMSNRESCFCSQRGGSGGNEFVSRILLHRGSTKCRRGKVTGCSRGGAEKGPQSHLLARNSMTNCTYSTGGKQINKVNESMKQNNGQQYTNNATRHGNTCERNVILWCLLSTYMFPPFSLSERLLRRKAQIPDQDMTFCLLLHGLNGCKRSNFISRDSPSL